VARSPLTDDNGIPVQGTASEAELAGYLNGLISESLARKADERPANTYAAAEETRRDPSPEPVDSQEDSPLPEEGQIGPSLSKKSVSSYDETPPGGRAAMSEELAALFRPTDRAATPTSSRLLSRCGLASPLESVVAGSEPSVFLRRFLQEFSRPRDLASTGLGGLDARLGGGFGPGVHLLGGPSALERSAVLDSAVWEAVASERPVVFYALREGSLRAWQRFIAALSSIAGSSTVSLETFRAGILETVDVEALTQLDTVFQRRVSPFLSLVESFPANPDALGAFVEDIRGKSREAEETTGRMPLVVLDDLERLFFLLGPRRLSRVLVRLDQVLSADSMPGLFATGLASRLTDVQESRAAQTILITSPTPPSESKELGLVNLRLLANRQTGWTGAVRLVVDRATGIVAEYGGPPQGTELAPDQ
jgi:hypothetical protein